MLHTHIFSQNFLTRGSRNSTFVGYLPAVVELNGWLYEHFRHVVHVFDERGQSSVEFRPSLNHLYHSQVVCLISLLLHACFSISIVSEKNFHRLKQNLTHTLLVKIGHFETTEKSSYARHSCFKKVTARMRHLLDFAPRLRWHAFFKFLEVSGQPSYIYVLSQYPILDGSAVIIIRRKAKEHSRTVAMLLCCTLQNIMCLCIVASKTSDGLYYSHTFSSY